MERCPTCSTPARPGAKFCTTCGFRFDESEAVPPAAAPNTVISAGIQNRADDDEADLDIGGWPSAPPPLDLRPSDIDQSPSDNAAEAPNADSPQPNDYLGFWPESMSDPWPEPVTTSSDSAGTVDPPPEGDASAPLGVTETPGPAFAARGAVHDLLDQLRAAIEAMDAKTPLDLSGVVSDLEVAVTPPGALPPDDIAELREALLAARERPRDIDTMVDLAKRIDALVALVIAYDRAIAAIERSLETLKPAESPSPTAVGERLS